MNLNGRIKEERERLGYSQTAFAALAEASKHSQINWEKGTGTPTAAVLAAWAAHGLDVLYVVTGQRMGGAPMAPVAEPTQQLSRRALAVAQNYEATSEEGKKIIEAAAFAAAQPAPGRGAKVA